VAGEVQWQWPLGISLASTADDAPGDGRKTKPQNYTQGPKPWPRQNQLSCEHVCGACLCVRGVYVCVRVGECVLWAWQTAGKVQCFPPPLSTSPSVVVLNA
jgi:hypothetical protein